MVLASYGFDLCFTVKIYAEGEDLVTLLGFKLLAVGIQGYLGKIGINLYGRDLLNSVGKASAADVNEGIL